ncbi:FAD-binding protein [Arabiibacter massiliensis]|uniref:FAD-binding protein n=1 Tax=Arabiibacter massiliensis TaxID=1870985 RepID=UPI0009BBB1F1|nr:FAD-binding protein [Arabiibacter massiliensis]
MGLDKTIGRKAVSRRSFLAGAATAGTMAALGLGGCAPRVQEAEADTGSGGVEPSGAPAWLGNAPEISDIAKTLDCDVLIVGAGCTGLAAGATAAQLGLDFLLCEKSDHIADNHWDIGAVNTRFTPEDHQIDKGRLLNELNRYASFKNDASVSKVWIDESAEMIEWLYDLMSPYDISCEVDTENGGDGRAGGTMYYMPFEKHGFVYSNPSFPGWPFISQNPCFQEVIEASGKQILFKHDLVKLVREDDNAGRVSGAVFETDEGFVQVNARKGIVLATGGYAGNPTMVRAINPIVPKCVTAVDFNQNNTGMGIKAGMWIGAAKDVEPSAMIFDRGGVEPGVDAGYVDESDDAIFPGQLQQLGIGSMPFLKVDRHGLRITNESANYDAICHAAAQRPGGVWCEVFDVNAPQDVQVFQTQGCSNNVWRNTLNGRSVEEAYAKEIEMGVIQKADTLEELADKLGFEGANKEAFLAAVDRYNHLYDQGVDEDFGKEAYRLSAIREAPYYGAWFGGSLLTTLDGLRINKNMQVLDNSNEIIEGLFAAGTCSGSFYSGNYPVYLVGNCMGRNITFGRHAVRYIAGDLD